MNKSFETLEYGKIKEKLKEFTASDLGKKRIEKLVPSTDIKVITNTINQTSEAKNILTKSPHIPLHGLHDIQELISKIEKGGILYPNDLAKIASFLRGCRKMKKFMNSHDYTAPTLSSYRYSITEFSDIEAEIESSIEGSRVSDKASNELSKIRKKINSVEENIDMKMQNVLSSSKYKQYIQDFFVSKRNNRFVIPVKSSYKNQIPGTVVDASATGATVFIEPKAITKLTNELSILKSQQESEEYQILATISGYIALHIKQIKINLEVMAEYDFVFAKAKYSNSIDGVEVKVNNNDYIKIVRGKHPLLGKQAVPLNFEIGKDYRVLVITGPNTGGKTVSLKTIGLLTLMVQSGLHIPVNEESEIAVFDRILVDIGDKQSIEQSLSTFSGHMKNIIEIINKARYSTLILLDEIGTGTDPSEGASLATAILDELYRSGAITIASTHYGEIKDFADEHPGFENGCMEFDAATLSPLYKLSIGKAGKSNALWICERLGMRPKVIQRAKKYIESRQNIGINKFKYEIDNTELKIPRSKRKSKQNKKDKINDDKNELRKGDSVTIINTNEKGIVYKVDDEYGNVTVLINNQFSTIHRRRLKLHTKREDLYPCGYDLDTIFIPYKKRKLEHDLKRGSVKNVKEFRERIES